MLECAFSSPKVFKNRLDKGGDDMPEDDNEDLDNSLVFSTFDKNNIRYESFQKSFKTTTMENYLDEDKSSEKIGHDLSE